MVVDMKENSKTIKNMVKDHKHHQVDLRILLKNKRWESKKIQYIIINSKLKRIERILN